MAHFNANINARPFRAPGALSPYSHDGGHALWSSQPRKRAVKSTAPKPPSILAPAVLSEPRTDASQPTHTESARTAPSGSATDAAPSGACTQPSQETTVQLISIPEEQKITVDPPNSHDESLYSPVSLNHANDWSTGDIPMDIYDHFVENGSGSSPVTITGNEYSHSMAATLPPLSSITFQVDEDLQSMPWPSSEQPTRDSDDNYNIISASQNIRSYFRSSQPDGLSTIGHSPDYSANFTSHSQTLCGQLYTSNDWQIQQRAPAIDNSRQWPNDADMEIVGRHVLSHSIYDSESPTSSQDSKNYWPRDNFDDTATMMAIDKKFGGPANGNSPSPRAPSSRYTQCKDVVGTDAIRNAGKERRKCAPKFVCTYNEQCKSEFTRRHNLTNHLQTHLGKAGTNCEKCGKELARSSRGRHEKKCNPNPRHKYLAQS